MPTSTHWETASSPETLVKIGAFCRADVGIGPYNAHAKAARSASSLRKLQPVHHAGLCAGGDVCADNLTVLD